MSEHLNTEDLEIVDEYKLKDGTKQPVYSRASFDKEGWSGETVAERSKLNYGEPETRVMDVDTALHTAETTDDHESDIVKYANIAIEANRIAGLKPPKMVEAVMGNKYYEIRTLYDDWKRQGLSPSALYEDLAYVAKSFSERAKEERELTDTIATNAVALHGDMKKIKSGKRLDREIGEGPERDNGTDAA